MTLKDVPSALFTYSELIQLLIYCELLIILVMVVWMWRQIRQLISIMQIIGAKVFAKGFSGFAWKSWALDCDPARRIIKGALYKLCSAGKRFKKPSLGREELTRRSV